MPTQSPTTVTIRAKDYPSRDALEKYIEGVFGATPEPKDGIITGTDAELREHFLSHGDAVWGVIATSSNYKPVVNVPRVERGEIHQTKLNGVPV